MTVEFTDKLNMKVASSVDIRDKRNDEWILTVRLFWANRLYCGSDRSRACARKPGSKADSRVFIEKGLGA